MKSRINSLKYYFVAVLGVCSALITGYELLYDLPMKRCEAAHDWWSWKYRQCIRPVSISKYTLRPTDIAPAPQAPKPK